ncbi:putative treslin [Helianthus annuus]|nr:putative treslin [Helianthus annuus]KAJ0873188.1 putative treslin [Helianthus annuus]
MSDAIDFSKTHRIVLLIDLNPLLQNPNPNYITSILTTCNILLSFNPLQSSLFSFKFFFSSLSPLLSASTLHRLLPHHSSPSLSFNSPSQTLLSLSKTLTSISSSLSSTQLTYSPPNCIHTVASLLQLVRDNDWESDVDTIGTSSGKLNNDYINVRSNLVIMLSPGCRSLNSLAQFMCVDVDENCSLDACRARFRECFRAVNDVFNGRDIHFCWVDVCQGEGEIGSNGIAVIGDDVRKFGWGYCSAESIVLGSALVSFGLVYPNIAVSFRLVGGCGLDKAIRGQLNLEILDVSGKPLECKFCDLELMHLKGSSKSRFDDIGSSKGQKLSFANEFLGSLYDGSLILRVTAVGKYTKYEYSEEFSSEVFFVWSAGSGKKGKDGLDTIFAEKVLGLLAGESSELFEKKTVPTWQIFLSFLYREGYWALLSLSNSNGDSYTGILKPFTIHSAVLLLLDNNHSFTQSSGGTKLLMNEKFSHGDIDFQKCASPSGKYVHVGDGKRRKMKKHAYQDLTWSSFCKAAYEFSDVDLAEVYFANGLKTSKKLKFLKCWMKEVKKHMLNNMPHGLCQTGPDSNTQKETNVNDGLTGSYGENDELLSRHMCSDQSRMQDGAAIVSCSETVESFFSNLPRKIQHGLESDGMDLKILAERLVTSSIYWIRLKHEAMENLDESCTAQVAEIIKLLLREPKDLKEHKDDNAGSSSKYLVQQYELQIFLRLEILQSEYAGSIKGSVKMKLVKQICSLLEIVQFLVEGGFHGGVSLYDYVERTIKTRYSQNLGDVVDKIYDQMDLLPFGEENEDQALMFNSEDSNQSWREKHDRIDLSASKMIQDSLSIEDESCHQLEKANTSHECETQEDHEQKLNEARERRERARRFVSSSSRMPDLQRVWAPKHLKPKKVKHEPKSKKHRRGSYSVVCETPLTGNKPSRATQQNKGERSNPVSKALFQDDK